MKLAKPEIFKLATSIDIDDNVIEARIEGHVIRWRYKIESGGLRLDVSVDGLAHIYNMDASVEMVWELIRAAKDQQFDIADNAHSMKQRGVNSLLAAIDRKLETVIA